MHRYSRYKQILFIASVVLLGSIGTLPVHAESDVTHEKVIHLNPDDLYGHPIYQTRHLTLEPTTWRVRQWQTLHFPDGWGDDALYVELWDAGNRPIPGYVSWGFSGSTVDLSAIDATLYPSLRVIVFQSERSTSTWPATPLTVAYTEKFNTRLVVLLTFTGIGLLVLLIMSIRFQITPRRVWRTTVEVLRNPALASSGLSVVVLAWVIVGWSALFAIPLGSFAGWQQILYLFVKIPFLFFCSLLISGSANLVLAKLIGVTVSLRQLLVNAIQALAVTAITLASVSPILWWLFLSGEGHDGALVWSLLLFVFAYLAGVIRLFQQYRISGSKRPLVPVLLWMVLYGVVLLQVGWMLRPWVGVLDPVYHAVPFSRLYSGNVFEEILLTVSRL